MALKHINEVIQFFSDQHSLNAVIVNPKDEFYGSAMMI